jgi:threonine/homoserine/homoserine lactone efflux protein
METLIPIVIGLGLAIAVCSPVSVVTVIILLTMPSGRRRAIAFVAGWLLAIAVISALSVLVLHGQDFSRPQTTPSRAASWVEIVAGCVVLLVSIRAFRRRGGRAASADTPKWLDRLDETNWLVAVLVGAFMLTYSLTLAAAAEILKAHVSTADSVVAFTVFALASITSIVAPIVLVLVTPERSAERLEQWRRRLLGNSRTIGLVALMVIGAILAARSIHDLAT